MATIGSTYVDLIDVHKQGGHAAEASVIEILYRQNPILEDAVSVECNKGTIHRHQIRTGLPTASWGRLYKGTPQSKSDYQQVDDTTGFLEARSGVDTRLLKLNPGKENQIRLNEATGHLEGMNQSMAEAVFYEDTATNPDGFKGLAARFNVRGGGGAGNQVIHGGGSGSDNTSIWFVTWGARATHFIYPQGTAAGLQREDKGEQRVTDGNGDAYYVQEELFTWHNGIATGDWRKNARIANIDVSEVIAGSVDLYGLMRSAYYRARMDAFRRMGGGESEVEPMRAAIYCNATILEALDALGSNAGASDNFIRLRPMEIEGKEVLTFRGIPLRVSDAILNTEAVVPTA